MIDSNLLWKFHIESICHKISKLIGIIAKIRHYVPHRVLLSVYNSLIVPYLTYGICAWGNCALIFQRKTKENTLSLFLKSNCLPLPSLFLRDCSYLLFDSTDRQHQLVYSISLLKQVRFITTELDLYLATRFMLSSLELIKCMNFSRELVPKFRTLFLIRLNYLNVRPFVKR